MIFEEEQRFTQWWLWVILISVGILPIVGVYKQVLLGEPFGNNPMSNTGLIIFMVCMLLFVGLFRLMKLKTVINKNGIEISFSPFLKRAFKWEEITYYEIVNYGFVGGWGIRLGTTYGTVYNVKGNKGLALQLKNGKKYLIGTQKEHELKRLIDKMPFKNEL